MKLNAVAVGFFKIAPGGIKKTAKPAVAASPVKTPITALLTTPVTAKLSAPAVTPVTALLTGSGTPLSSPYIVSAAEAAASLKARNDYMAQFAWGNIPVGTVLMNASGDPISPVQNAPPVLTAGTIKWSLGLTGVNQTLQFAPNYNARPYVALPALTWFMGLSDQQLLSLAPQTFIDLTAMSLANGGNGNYGATITNQFANHLKVLNPNLYQQGLGEYAEANTGSNPALFSDFTQSDWLGIAAVASFGVASALNAGASAATAGANTAATTGTETAVTTGATTGASVAPDVGSDFISQAEIDALPSAAPDVGSDFISQEELNALPASPAATPATSLIDQLVTGVQQAAKTALTTTGSASNTIAATAPPPAPPSPAATPSSSGYLPLIIAAGLALMS